MTQMTKRNVLVTGGAGFIGGWLCRRLCEAGYRVTCLDNLSTGSRKNLDGCAVEFIEHDVIQPLEIEADYVFHLASRASPVDFQTHPIEIMLTNSVGIYNMLSLSRRSGARLLLASTSEVYGDPLQHPQDEQYWGNINPVGVRSCYDESKRFSEALTIAFHRTEGLDVRIARIFNTYGEHMRKDDGRVIPNFINQALRDEPITVYGGGTQTRSFCYVSDLVEGLVRLMFREGLGGEVINLGNPVEITIGEVASLTRDMANSKSEIVYQPLPQDDPARRKPEISKAGRLLGWQPAVSLEDGLKRTIDYFRAML